MTSTLSPRLDDQKPSRRIVVNLGHLLRAEYTKVVTLVSTWLLLLLMLSLALLGAASLSHSSLSDPGSARSGGAATIASNVGQMSLIDCFFVAVVAVLLVSREYSSGEATSTYLASPKRLGVLAAKTITALGIAVLSACVTSLGAWMVSSALLASTGLRVSLIAPEVLQASGQTVAWLAVIAFVSVMIATLVRNAALTISIMFTFLAVLPVVSNHLPRALQDVLLTSNQTTISLLIYGSPSIGDLAPRLVVLAAWVVLPAIAAGVILRRRAV